MMRYLTMDQRNLYKQYSKLSKIIIENAELEKKPIEETIWNALTKEGIWALPIAKEYGGKGQSWQDIVIAMDAVFSHYFNTDLLSLFISQVSCIYLISQYGTNPIKIHYLPRLMEGEIITVYHPYSHKNNKLNKIFLFKERKICIYIREINKNIVFYIYEKKPNHHDTVTSQSLKSVFNTENTFIAKDVGVSALYDLIDFERLFYAVISASFSNKLMQLESSSAYQ